MTDERKLKRQAVWVTFSDLLEKEQLIQVIEELDMEYFHDDMSSLINYVNDVGKKNGIERALLMVKYAVLHSYLNTGSVTEIEDPLIYVQSKVAPADINALSDHVPEPVFGESGMNSPDGEIKIGENQPRMTVFSYFLKRLLLHFSLDEEELLEEIMGLVKKERGISKPMKIDMIGWLQDPSGFQWGEIPSEEEMSLLIHLFYIMCCDFLGPVKADALFHQVLDDSQQLPAAKAFNPKAFL